MRPPLVLGMDQLCTQRAYPKAYPLRWRQQRPRSYSDPPARSRAAGPVGIGYGLGSVLPAATQTGNGAIPEG